MKTLSINGGISDIILYTQDIQKIFEQSTFSPVKEMQALSLTVESIVIYPPFPLTETEGRVPDPEWR